MRRQILTADDVTQEHIEEAADMREGMYGGERLTWEEVVDRLEAIGEDWGNSMESEAIRYLQRETRKLLRERE